MNTTITCKELNERLAAGALVIDVMTPEDYADCHLVGAKNACIYEMVFLERIAECAPDLSRELVLYDATGSKLTAQLARERLTQAGYLNVSIIEGGLCALRSAGLPIEGNERCATIEPELSDGTYQVDVERSTLEWIGRNLNNRHHGRVSVQSGEIVVQGGNPLTGDIVLDMSSIINLDLQDAALLDLLIRHLKSEDFFAVERFPTASFRLTGWRAREGGVLGAPNGIATGELTIKDIARVLSFPAIVAPQSDGSIKAHAIFDFDRTLWNVGYGSSKLYERLGMHLVHDIISLEMFVVAQKP